MNFCLTLIPIWGLIFSPLVSLEPILALLVNSNQHDRVVDLSLILVLLLCSVFPAQTLEPLVRLIFDVVRSDSFPFYALLALIHHYWSYWSQSGILMMH